MVMFYHRVKKTLCETGFFFFFCKQLLVVSLVFLILVFGSCVYVTVQYCLFGKGLYIN